MCPTSSVSPLHASLTLEGFRGLPRRQKGQISRNTAVYLCMLWFPNRTQTCKSTERPGAGPGSTGGRKTSDWQIFSVVVKQYGSTAYNSYKYLCIRLQSIEHLCNSGQTYESAIHSMCNANYFESSVNDQKSCIM